MTDLQLETLDRLAERLAGVARDNPEAVEQFLIVQEALRNPATVVRLRAGFLLCREYMARFVEQGGDAVTANSIRANWIPAFGDDPGAPRRYKFDELAVENGKGGWDTLPVDASKEAMCEAAVVMFALGMRVDGEQPA